MVALAKANEWVSWHNIVDVLSGIDALEPDATGELVFGDESLPIGRLYVESGRICWATARALSSRLTRVLRERSSLDDISFNQIYERCRAEGTPIGQMLVEEGKLDPAVLLETLRQHSAESIIELTRDGAASYWIDQPSRGYEAEFTFTAPEMTLELSALVYPDQEEAAAAELEVYGGERREGFAFLLETDQSIAIPLAARAHAARMQDLAMLAHWATVVLAGAFELGERPRYSIGFSNGPGSIVVWRSGDLMFVVKCEDREALAEVTSRFLARQRSNAPAHLEPAPR